MEYSIIIAHAYAEGACIPLFPGGADIGSRRMFTYYNGCVVHLGQKKFCKCGTTLLHLSHMSAYGGAMLQTLSWLLVGTSWQLSWSPSRLYVNKYQARGLWLSIGSSQHTVTYSMKLETPPVYYEVTKMGGWLSCARSSLLTILLAISANACASSTCGDIEATGWPSSEVCRISIFRGICIQSQQGSN